MAIACPRCGASHDGVATAGQLVCASCHHRWALTFATIDAMPTETVADRRPSVRAPAQRTASGEYLPDEPSPQVKGQPLTERHDVTAFDESSSSASAASSSSSSSTRSARAQGTTRSRRVMEVGPPAQAANPADVGPTIDADLFDQLEREAQMRRSAMATMPEIVSIQVEPGTASPTSDRTGLTDCPVCGHRFPIEEGQAHHQCPQCGTGWDDSSGRLKVSPQSGDLLIGRTLGGCLIDRKLGEGGMGAVYHARQLSLDRSIAIKILPADLARNRNFIQRFEREAKSLARINHPNILHIYDFGEDPQLGLYFMLIEYVEGMDLGEVLNRRGALGQVEVLDLLRQALMGLEAAAEKGVIHRDIKPDNLMVSNGGLVKVSDFGLAKGMVAQTGVTAVGVRVGTPAFMSPEQCDGIEVDVRSDIYNLGATAFLCLTGRLPFDGETPFAIMLKHKTEPVPSLTAIDPTIDRGVERVIQGMLAKKPEERCTSLRDLIETVEHLEVSLAGTQSILRKSRGPFRALLSGRGPALPVLRPQEPEEDWQRLVENFRTQAEVALPVPPPAAPAPPALPPAPADLPLLPPGPGLRPPGRPSSRMGVPSVAAEGAVRGSAASRRLDAELSQARQRGRRSEWESLIQEGEVHQRAGRYDSAARSYEGAARLVEEESQRADLVMRAAEMRSSARIRRRLRTVLLSVLGVVAVVGTIGLVTPWLQCRIADHRLDGLVESIKALPSEQRAAELRAFAALESRPWWWYPVVYRQTYPVPAAERAQGLAEQEGGIPTAPRPVATVVDREGITRLVNDGRTPWSEVLRTARGQRFADGVVQEILRKAAGELEAQRSDEAVIAAAWAEGDHRHALELSAAFRARHPRAEASRLAALPLPGRLVITAAGATLPSDLQIRIDGVAVATRVIDVPGGEPTAEAMVCRRPDRPVTIEITASGYRTMADSLDSGANGEQVRVVLRPQPLWAVPGPEPLPGSALYAAGPGAILVDRRSQLSRVELTEGRLLARLERTPGVPTGLAGIIMPLPAGRWGLGLEDRSLAQVSPDLVIEQIFQRSASPIIAWSEAELTYRPGRRVRLTIEDAAPRVLVAREGATEWWRYPPKTPLTATLVPGLFHCDDQVFLIDDVAVHVIDEDGSACRVFALASRRVGPVVTRQIPGGHLEFLVPTMAGVQHLLPGPRATPLRQIVEPVLGSCGPVRLATAGEGIVATTSNRLFAIESGGKAPRWALPLAAEPAWGPVVADGVVALADAAGTVGLFTLKDGTPLRRLVHGVPLAATPILLPGQVVVLDRSGTLTAYPR